MKLNNFIGMMAVLALIASITSCKKDEVKDTEKPTITISEPMANDTISLSEEDSVHLMFSASDNDGLHVVNTNITDHMGASVYTSADDVDATTFSFHDHFHPTGITGVTAFMLKVDATDHSSNSTSKTVMFYVMP